MNAKSTMDFIQAEQTQRTGKLNLTGCGLNALPLELTEMDWLEALYLSPISYTSSQLTGITERSPYAFEKPKDNFLYRAPKEISALKKLKTLVLCDGIFTDLDFLKSLDQLEYLFLHRLSVADLSPISHLRCLRVLDISNSGVYDLRPLAALSNLEVLIADESRIKYLLPLEKLPQLHTLSLSRTLVSDIAVLGNLFNLNTVDLSWTSVSDASPLFRLPNLSKLSLPDGCPVQQVAAFSILPYLTIKEANQLNTLKPSASVHSITIQEGIYNDLSALQSFPNLEHLSIADAQIAESSVALSLPNLKTLYFRNVGINSWELFSQATNLTTLDIHNCTSTNWAGISTLSALRTAKFSSSRLPDSLVLMGLTQLESLHLDCLNLQEWQGLEGMLNLQHLYIEENNPNRQQQFSLPPLPSLKSLHLKEPFRFRWQSIESLTQLEQLTLEDTNLDPDDSGIVLGHLSGFVHSGNHWKDLKWLNFMLCLERLVITAEQLDGIEQLKKLKQLRIAGLEVINFKALADLPCLQSFSCMEWRNDQYSEIWPQLPKVETLEVGGSRLKNLDFLQNQTQMKHLTVNSGSLQSVEPLKKLRSLESFDLRHYLWQYSPLQDFSPLKSLANLRQINGHTLEKHTNDEL